MQPTPGIPVAGGETAAIENPVWAGLMAMFCRQRGLSVEIIDAEADGLGPEIVADCVKHFNAVLAAVVVYGHQPSASTQIMTASGQVCSAIKTKTPDQSVLLLGARCRFARANLDGRSRGFCGIG